MSDKELKFTQKLFAVVERMVKSTPIHSIDIVPDPETGRVKNLDFYLSADTQEMDFSIPLSTHGLPFTIDTDIVGILGEFSSPTIVDAAMDSIKANVIDEDVVSIRQAVVENLDDEIPIGSDVRVHDLFSRYKIKPLKYSAAVHTVKPHKWHVISRDVPVQMDTHVKENVFFFRRLTVERQSAHLPYISEKEQLIFWKNAVLKSKKEPRQLNLIGIYTGIPYPAVDTKKISLNPGAKTLTYHFKDRIPRNINLENLEDVALFATAPGSGDKPALVMVKK